MAKKPKAKEAKMAKAPSTGFPAGTKFLVVLGFAGDNSQMTMAGEFDNQADAETEMNSIISLNRWGFELGFVVPTVARVSNPL